MSSLQVGIYPVVFIFVIWVLVLHLSTAVVVALWEEDLTSIDTVLAVVLSLTVQNPYIGLFSAQLSLSPFALVSLSLFYLESVSVSLAHHLSP